MTGIRRRRLWIALGAVVLLAAVAIVPSARGALADLLTFGGRTFSPQTSVGTAPDTNDQQESKVVSLAEAQSIYGFDVPSTAPPGFELDEEHVSIAEMSIPGFSAGEALIDLSWNGQGGSVIRLSVQRTDPTVEYDDVVAAEGVREILVNGIPVALVSGAWDADTGRWSYDGPVTLSWRQDNDIYDLQGDRLTYLLPMAESMPHFR